MLNDKKKTTTDKLVYSIRAKEMDPMTRNK